MSMMGEITFFLDLQVSQSPYGIFINQSNYVLEILKKYGIDTCDPIGTPMEIKNKLDLDQNGTLLDATIYQSKIGALMYLTSSRPDIVHATCLCARYQAKPIEKHLKEVKRIFRYLRGTVNMGLWYTKDSGFELTRFFDADYARCRDTFKSNIWYQVLLYIFSQLYLKTTLTGSVHDQLYVHPSWLLFSSKNRTWWLMPSSQSSEFNTVYWGFLAWAPRLLYSRIFRDLQSNTAYGFLLDMVYRSSFVDAE
ncbi:hypothetical protein Tco_1445490 [Tanacetum coccineum]